MYIRGIRNHAFSPHRDDASDDRGAASDADAVARALRDGRRRRRRRDDAMKSTGKVRGRASGETRETRAMRCASWMRRAGDAARKNRARRAGAQRRGRGGRSGARDVGEARERGWIDAEGIGACGGSRGEARRGACAAHAR